MIKGVSRQIIEVSDPESIYYDKAWLVVKPEYASVERVFLEKEAKKMLKSMDCPGAMKPKRAFMFWALRLGLSALLGALLGGVFTHFFA